MCQDYSRYKRYRKFSIEEVRNLWEDAEYEHVKANGGKRRAWRKVQIADNVIVKMDSQRYQVFFEHGTDCVECGLKGAYFWLEQNKYQPGKGGAAYHFNLYGVDENGNEVQLTKDHIIPKSKGGKNHISNYQTMCEKCNTAKGNKVAA